MPSARLANSNAMQYCRRVTKIRSISAVQKTTVRWSTESDLGWSIAEVDGERIIHLETYGSDTRVSGGTPSQQLDFDETAAAALLTVIRTAFPQLA